MRHYRGFNLGSVLLLLTLLSETSQGGFELSQSAEFPPTTELTHDAESKSFRRLSVSARACIDLAVCAAFFVSRERTTGVRKGLSKFLAQPGISGQTSRSH